jgi:hypothetical protein
MTKVGGKSRELWESVQKASWSDVILDESMKQSLIGDVEGFDERDTYREFSVPWKVYRAFVTRLHPRHCTILLFMVYVSWWLWVWCTVSLIHYNDGKDFSANNFYVNVKRHHFYGPPETAKRSPSALMKSLSTRQDPLPTLYVKSLVSYGGPEYSIRHLPQGQSRSSLPASFRRPRQPCNRPSQKLFSQ